MKHTTDKRATLLLTWIRQQFDIVENSFVPVSGDASFRRYFRFTAKHAFEINNARLIAVDAPPELENSRPFIDIASLLRRNNIPAPEIYNADLDQGFYLQQDFGDQLLLDALDKNSADNLYQQAMDEIINMQYVDITNLPLYDSKLLQREMNLFSEWYLSNI